MNSKKTSSSVASQASRALRSSSTSKIQRQLAGSALSQAKSGHQTGKKMEGVASAALNIALEYYLSSSYRFLNNFQV